MTLCRTVQTTRTIYRYFRRIFHNSRAPSRAGPCYPHIRRQLLTRFTAVQARLPGNRVISRIRNHRTRNNTRRTRQTRRQLFMND